MLMCVEKIHASMTCTFIIFTEVYYNILQIDSSKQTTEHCFKATSESA